MAQTLIASQTPLGPYGAAPGAGALDLTWTTADTTNGNSFNLTAKELLLVQNPDSASHHFTITSVADSKGRSGDITSYAIAAGKVSAFSFRNANEGWGQPSDSNRVHISSDSALVEFAILTLP